MVSMVISNVPDDLHRRLKDEAARTGRSVDQQVLAILDRALRAAPPVVLPTPIEPLRPITADEVAAAIREGRE